MRLWHAIIPSIFVAAICLYANGQSAGSKDAQTSESKGMPPRSAPTDYQAQGHADTVTIAAEFMGHAVPKADGPLSTEDYVVIETGFFGPPNARLKLSVEDFSLRINGKKNPLSGQPYGLVISSLKDPQWSPPTPAEPKSKGSFGTGGSKSDSPPPVVHVPIELQRAMAQHLQKAALPEGDRTLPQAGLIFFQYRGKTQNIHSMELMYEGPAGKATLALQP